MLCSNKTGHNVKMQMKCSYNKYSSTKFLKNISEIHLARQKVYLLIYFVSAFTLKLNMYAKMIKAQNELNFSIITALIKF